MINSPNIVGLRTSIAASRMMSSRDLLPSLCPSRIKQFSIMITELSTIRPKSIAPKLIKLAVTPVASIKLVANSIDSGIASAVMSPARKLPSITSSTRMTSPPPSIRFVTTVLSVRPMSAARS